MQNKLLEEKLNKVGSNKEPFLFIISYDLKDFYIEKLCNLPRHIKYKLNSKHTSKIKNKTILLKEPISSIEYKKKFDFLQEQIKIGNSYLLNLTAKTKIKTDYSLDEIYEKVNSKKVLQILCVFLLSVLLKLKKIEFILILWKELLMLQYQMHKLKS